MRVLCTGTFGSFIGFSAACGTLFIRKAFGSSIAMTGSPVGAHRAFLKSFVICLAITWVFYTRLFRRLHDLDRGRLPASNATQPAKQPCIHPGGFPRRPVQSHKGNGLSLLRDRLYFLQSKGLERFSDGHGHVTRENRDWDDTCRKLLAPRQDRGLDPPGGLHRVVLVECRR